MVEDNGVDKQGSVVLRRCTAEATNLAGLQLGDVTRNSAPVTIEDMRVVNCGTSSIPAQYTNDAPSPVDLGWLGWDLAANSTEPPCGFAVPQDCGLVRLTNLTVIDSVCRPWLQLASENCGCFLD